MESLKQRIKSKKKNIHTRKKNKDSILIKTKNSCHTFKISFLISTISSIPKEFHPQNLFKNTQGVDQLMIIQAELINKNEPFFNENNEEIEISDKYYEIYSLAELKNNTKGFEWFTELYEFKQAFINGINSNNFEFLVIKNILLLSINIINIFGNNKDYHLILRPWQYIVSMKENENNINNNDIREKHSLSVVKKLKKDNRNIIYKHEEGNKELLDYSESNKNNDYHNKNHISHKKMLRKKKKRNNKIFENDNTIPTDNSLNLENTDNKSENNLNNMLNSFIQNLEEKMKSYLTEFEEEGLIKISKIIKDTEEDTLIGDMISTLKIKKYRLLFRATRDGDSANKFHSICDNYKNLIILIETQKGLRFGGFTSSKFRGSSHLKIDNNAFLFSLDLKKVYNIISGQYAIYCYQNSGPCFSQGSLYIPNNFFYKYGKTGTAGGPYQFEKDYELNGGEEKFLVKELEIFQVKIEDN